ncbi:hypothetical protein [Aeromonas media]|uniref:hypothetical protein n=1 Tax=Aeromonas media TaxID=651 RepID=UPI0012E0AF5F|nr:hypothetical protein [Aeromonas media]MBS4642044.1 hypothetical protein [Aeromonas media]
MHNVCFVKIPLNSLQDKILAHTIEIVRGRVLHTQPKRLEWLAARRLESAIDVADAD